MSKTSTNNQEKFEVTGIKGVKSKPFRQTFKSQAAFEKWLEKNEGNVVIEGFRNIEEGR